MAGEGDAGRLDIETALAWLRKELVRFEFSTVHYIISHLDANIRQCPMITFCLQQWHGSQGQGMFRKTNLRKIYFIM